VVQVAAAAPYAAAAFAIHDVVFWLMRPDRDLRMVVGQAAV
jgi:hypothetical protein